MSNNDQDKGSLAESEGPPPDDEEQDIEAAENEEAIHERLHREKHHHHKIWTQNREAGGHKMHKHHHHHHHHHHQPHGHIKEFIKPDPTVRRARLPGSSQATVHIVQPPSKAQSPRPVATAVDEEQLQKRLMESVSEKKQPKSQSASVQQPADESRSATTTTTATATTSRLTDAKTRSTPMPTTAAASTTLENKSDSSSSGSSSSYSSSSREGQHSHLLRGADKSSSPPPAAIIIPPNVAKSLSSRRLPVASAPSQRPESPSLSSSTSDSNVSRSPESQGSVITREQLEYGSLLRSNEVQVLYRSPESVRARSIASKTIKGHLMKHQPAPDKSQNKQQDS